MKTFSSLVQFCFHNFPGSHFIVNTDPGVMVKSPPNLISLAVVKPKEDGRHNEFDPNKDSSRAGNERGYRFFSFILICLSFLRTAPTAFRRD